MDPQGNPSGDSGLTDDEKMKVGLQQAALIQMQQNSQDEELREKARRQQMMIEQQKEQEMIEAQRKAMQLRMEHQQAAEQHSIQLQLQAQALKERQQEEELKRLQERAMMERQLEEQESQGPPQPPRLMAAPPQPPQMQGAPHMTSQPRFPMPGPAPPGQLGPPQMGQAPPGQSVQGGLPPMTRPAGSLPPPPMPHISVGPSMPPRPPFSQSQPPVQQMPPQMQPSRGPPPPLMQQQPQRPVPQLGQPPTGLPHPGSRSDMPHQQGGMPPISQGGMPPNQQSVHREGQFQPSGDDRGRPPPLMGMETRPAGPPPVEDDEDPGLQKNQQSPPEKEEEPEFKLPQALEKVLAFKDVRVQEVGVKPEEMERIEKGEIIEEEPEGEDEYDNRRQMTVENYGLEMEEEEEDEEDETQRKQTKAGKKSESKNKRRKKKKKKAKQRKAEQTKVPTFEQNKEQPKKADDEDDVEIEYVVEEIELDRTEPSYREFNKIFQAFKIADPEKTKEALKAEEEAAAKLEALKSKVPKQTDEEQRYENIYGNDDSGDEEKEDDPDKPKLSKKKMKKLNRLSVAELKQLVTRPDVVEMHDVTARDPKLLISLKATRNSVPVPRHWCFKRKYLQGKRGIEKPPFDLPDFIKNTGIMEMRQALQEKEDAKNLKAKMREKVRPKMGKIDIDYQKLHDAFFKYQTKPKMTIHGDLYYEGKEFETRLKEKKPGNLTDDLRTALGMPIGANADKYPPPWLIAMQRYGPPPSYPNLKVPGLNGPIPEGCSFGYHAGGWGKPPVDENGKPLYGDVFGTQGQEVVQEVEEEDVDKTKWGELESESEEESESESESEEEGEAIDSGLVTPGDPGLITPSGVTSVPIGMETPDMIELRKKRIEDAMDQGGDTPALYQVLPEKKTNVGGAMMGSAHVYDISAVPPPLAQKSADNPEGVEVALNPDELDLDTAAMQAKYEQQVREQQSQLEKEDLSDMVADHAAKQAKKRKKQQQDTSKSAKKYKEFKF